MFTARKSRARILATRPKATTMMLSLVQRMRALSVNDDDLARLLQELEPHLPDEDTARGPAAAAQCTG